MTTGDSFSGALKSALQKDAASDHGRAYAKLLEMAKNLASTISEDSDQVRAVLEPGHTTQRGQQFRVKVYSPSQKDEIIFFRAHIPVGGFPVSFDFLDTKGLSDFVEAKDENEMESVLLAFLTQPESLNLIRTWRDYVAGLPK